MVAGAVGVEGVEEVLEVPVDLGGEFGGEVREVGCGLRVGGGRCSVGHCGAMLVGWGLVAVDGRGIGGEQIAGFDQVVRSGAGLRSV